MVLRFGHWFAICPRPKHLKHCMSRERFGMDKALPLLDSAMGLLPLGGPPFSREGIGGLRLYELSPHLSVTPP